ncbi:MAG: hypothetical protein ACM3ZE_14300, partial [Myxococcales bacterium]
SCAIELGDPSVVTHRSIRAITRRFIRRVTPRDFSGEIQRVTGFDRSFDKAQVIRRISHRGRVDFVAADASGAWISGDAVCSTARELALQIDGGGGSREVSAERSAWVAKLKWVPYRLRMPIRSREVVRCLKSSGG